MKSNILRIVSVTLYALGLLQLAIFLERKFGWKRAVLACSYHQIGLEPPSATVSLFEVGTTAETLDRQISELKKWIRPLDTQYLVTWLDGDVNLDNDGFIVTFDDGYQDNLTVASPILQKHDVNPVVFISTDYVDTGKIYWWTRLTAIMKQIPVESWRKLLTCEIPPEVKQIVLENPLVSWSDRVEARRKIAGYLVNQSNPNDITDQFARHFTLKIDNPLPVLTWNEIIAIRSTGFSIGAHTHTHRLLTKLETSEIQEEFRRSNKTLTDMLGQWSFCLAYPAGDFDKRVIAAAESCGYRAAFTTQPGLIYTTSDRFQLPRVYLSKYSSAEICFFVFAMKLSKYISGSLANRILRATL